MKIGDRVRVLDEGLAQIRKILSSHGYEPEVPNDTGYIDEIHNGFAYVIFDDSGQCAPYRLDECELI